MVVSGSSNKYAFYLLALINLTCLFLSIHLGSRSFTLGYLFAGIFLLFAYKRFQIKKSILFSSALGLILIIFAFTFLLKTDSSLGRLLIYKVSWNMLADHPLTGIGWNKFGHDYGLYQAAYFESGKYQAKELLLADNTYYTFNDYFQLIIETGIAGWTGIAAIAVVVIKATISALRKSSHPLLYLATGQALAICTAALFNHVFEKILFQCLIIISLSVIIYFSGWIGFKKKYFIAIVFLLLTMLCTNHFWLYLYKYRSSEKWKEAALLSNAGYHIKALNAYENLYPELKSYPEFLENYVNALANLNFPGGSENILKELTDKRTRNTYYLTLGDYYLGKLKYDQAEKAYKQGILIVPNRFRSHYKLFNFYDQTGQTDKLIHYGKVILKLPIKIPSRQVNLIRNKIRTRLGLKQKP
jgi:tetratricopeptide (TPR) repeat protein